MRYFATKPENFLDKVEIFVEPTNLEKICDQQIPAGLYRVLIKTEEDHEWGHGGFREITAQLLKGDRLIILAINYNSWDTTSDDSTDYASLKVRRTYLLQDDPVAKQIFDAACTQVQQ